MWLLWPLASFGFAVVLHGLAMRLPLRIDGVRRFLLVGIPTGGVLAVYSIAALGFTSGAFASILLYAFLSELYVFSFTLVLSSVSVTMLMMLRRGALAPTALTRTYDPRRMVTLRLGWLIKQGLVARNGERLGVTARGMRLHTAFGVLQHFFGHDLQ